MEDEKVVKIDTSQAQANVDKLNKSLDGVDTKLNNISNNVKQAGTNISAGFNTAGKALETFKASSGAVGQATSALQSSLTGVNGTLKGLTSALPFLNQGLTGAASGFAGMTAQALAFIATPVGAVVAAIALALKLLADAFKRNEDAMASLKKLMTPFQALWQMLQRIFDEVVVSLTNVIDKFNGTDGSSKALTITTKALSVVLGVLNGALKVVERNVTAVFNVIGKLTSAAKNFIDKTPLKGFLQDLGTAFEKVRGAVVKFVNTVANSKLGKLLGWDIITDEIKNAVKATDELTESNQKIVDLENDIAKTKRKNTEEIAENERKISELREKASDKEKYNAEERKKFIEEAGNLEAENLEKTKNLRQKEFDLIKLKNSLTSSGTKDLQAESDALAALTKAETDYNNNKRNLNKQLSALNKEAAADAAAAAKAQQEARRRQAEEEQQLLDENLKKQQEYLDKQLEINKRSTKSDEEKLEQEIFIETQRLTLYEEGTLAREKQLTKITELENQLTSIQNAERDSLQKSYDDYLKNNEDSNLTYLDNLANQQLEEEKFLENLRDKGIIDEEEYQNQLTQITEKYAKKRAQYHLQNSLTVANGIADILGSIASMQDENDKEGFERSKNLQVAAATINMLTGITAALSGLFTGKTGPWDWVLAGVQAATIAASGIANITKIKSTKFDDKGTSSASASVPSATAISASVIQPAQYEQAVDNAQLETKIGDTRVYVTEEDITNTQKRVSVQEQENTY